jgi:hypothetical protein
MPYRFVRDDRKVQDRSQSIMEGVSASGVRDELNANA